MDSATMAAITDEVLDARLADWVREYGGGRYENLGFSTGEHILAKLVKFGGFMPSSGGAPAGTASMTAADEVERVVRRLAQGWPGHALVLRCDYFHPDQAMPNRLDWLRSKGHKMGRSKYYVMLASAKGFVREALA